MTNKENSFDTQDIVFEQFLEQIGWNQKKMELSPVTNKQFFIEQYSLNPKAWRAAIKFLKKKDLQTMDLGRYDLSAKDTYAIISEYQTKDIETSYFETHRKFIDIQYVISGKEYIILTSLDDKKNLIQPYDEENDFELFQKNNENFLFADSKSIFVLFPQDGHKPGIKVNESELVRKLVLKIPYIKSNMRFITH